MDVYEIVNKIFEANHNFFVEHQYEVLIGVCAMCVVSVGLLAHVSYLYLNECKQEKKRMNQKKSDLERKIYKYDCKE